MSFFKAYDMRGTYGVDFNLELVQRIGQALPNVVGKGKWLIGRDCRVTSSAVRDSLVKGLSAAGVKVVDLGLCSTPMVYHYTAQGDFDGSVMITASHNPPSDNGLKVSKRGALPVGYADGLDKVEKLCSAASPVMTTTDAEVESFDGLPQYLEWMRRQNPKVVETLSKLKVAVDCSNGMASLFAKAMFPNAIIINDTLDGNFPSHSPNPLKAEAREQVSELVRTQGLDCGVIFDGDADRCMFVDEHGEFVQPDYLIPIVAKATIKSKSGAIVIHDVRTSRGAIEELKRMGCVPRMVPVGHAFAKPILRECGGACGGELAGHYYFSEFSCCDSGLLAALRILQEVALAKEQGKTFSEMMHPILGVYDNSGELNFKVEDKDAAIARVLAVAKEKLPAEVSRSEMDGIRIEYDEGWINIRKSNTEPYLRLIVERKSAARDWVAILEEAINAG